MERELRRTREKVESGAEFIITQPVFSVEPLLAFLDKISYLKIPVIAGIFPLASYRNAEFMKNEVQLQAGVLGLKEVPPFGQPFDMSFALKANQRLRNWNPR